MSSLGNDYGPSVNQPIYDKGISKADDEKIDEDLDEDIDLDSLDERESGLENSVSIEEHAVQTQETAQAAVTVSADAIKNIQVADDTVVQQAEHVHQQDLEVLDLQKKHFEGETREAHAEETHLDKLNTVKEELQNAVVMDNETEETITYRPLDFNNPQEMKQFVEGKLHIAGRTNVKEGGAYQLRLIDPEKTAFKGKKVIIRDSKGTEHVIGEKNIKKLKKSDQEALDKAVKKYHHHYTALNLLRNNPQQYFVKFPSQEKSEDGKSSQLALQAVQTVRTSSLVHDNHNLSRSNLNSLEKGLTLGFANIAAMLKSMINSVAMLMYSMQQKKAEKNEMKKLEAEQRLTQEYIKQKNDSYYVQKNEIEQQQIVNDDHMKELTTRLYQLLPSDKQHLSETELKTVLNMIIQSSGPMEGRAVVEVLINTPQTLLERAKNNETPFAQETVLISKWSEIISYLSMK